MEPLGRETQGLRFFFEKFNFTLTSSLFRSESLYLLGFTDGRENKHPSRLPPVQGPLFSKCEGANPKKGG